MNPTLTWTLGIDEFFQITNLAEISKLGLCRHIEDKVSNKDDENEKLHGLR